MKQGKFMATYLVGYDLDKPGQDYEDLINAIKAYGTWWHHLDSTWIICTDSSTTEIRNNLKQHIDSNDKLLVVALTGAGAWYGFNQKGSEWLKSNL